MAHLIFKIDHKHSKQDRHIFYLNKQMPVFQATPFTEKLMIKIQSGNLSSLAEQARLVFSQAIEPVLQAKLDQTTVIIKPRTCYKVRDCYHNSHKSFNNGLNKIPFDSLQVVKNKLADGLPFIVWKDGKERCFDLESDVVGGDYNKSVLVPRILNNLIRNTTVKIGILTLHSVKIDVKALSENERQCFAWLLRLHSLDVIISHYGEYMHADSYYLYGEYIVGKIKSFANKAVLF